MQSEIYLSIQVLNQDFNIQNVHEKYKLLRSTSFQKTDVFKINCQVAEIKIKLLINL